MSDSQAERERERTLVQLKRCQVYLLVSAGMFVSVGYASSIVESWAARLQLRPEAVSMLVSQQPALLEITPVTVKARLEGLSALFGVPLEIATQLVMRHPAMLIIPPNASIVRVKNLSSQIGSSMQQAGERGSERVPRHQCPSRGCWPSWPLLWMHRLQFLKCMH